MKMKNWQISTSHFWLRILVVFLIGVIMALAFACPSSLSNTHSRDKFLQPFLSTSIWNMPIGDHARYVNAHIDKSQQAAADVEYFFRLKDKYPQREVYAPGTWGEGRCTGTKYMDIAIPIPDDLIIPDATKNPHHTPNNVSAFLMPDGRTLVQLSP